MSTNCDTTAEELVQIMKQEISLLEEFRQAEVTLKDVIKSADWGALSDMIDHMAALAEWIETTEHRRHSIYAQLCAKAACNDDSIPFYQAIVGISEPLRSECAELYRSLKFAIVKIKGITHSLDTHIRSVSDTMQSVLNEILPYRKGKLYSRKGKTKDADTEPLVVNQHQ